MLDAGSPTGEKAVIGRVLSPLKRSEVGTIRCIGLNVSFSFLSSFLFSYLFLGERERERSGSLR